MRPFMMVSRHFAAGAAKKTKENKLRRCDSYTHFFSFLAEIINILCGIQNKSSLKC